MKRFYLCPVVAVDAGGIEGRALKLPPGVNHSAVIADGIPWGLAIVAATDHTAMVNDDTLDKLPEITMDATLSTLTAAQRNKLVNRMQALGVDITGISGSTTFRQALRRIGRHLDANFIEHGFDVSE